MDVNTQIAAEIRLNAERAVVGSLLIAPELARDILSKVSDQDFLEPGNRDIFRTARALFRAGCPPDPITIRNKLGDDYTQRIMSLMDITPTAANWEEYAEAMREQAALARIHDLADKLSAAATLDACRPVCADLGQMLSDGRRIDAMTMREMADDFFCSQEPDQPAVEYITTGLSEIDSGSYFQRGDVLVLGGYPSDGKTAFALMLAYHMASRHKVGFFSLETSVTKVRDRIMAHIGQISFGAIKKRELQESDWQALAEKSADCAKRNLTVLHASGMTATELAAVSQAYGFEVIFVDYVQLITPETDRRAPRSEQMAEVSRSLHTFAQKSGTTVVELAQLSRQERSGGWREPDMHDLKESGQFEQDADAVLLLYRPNPKDDELDQEKNRILRIAKNKEGRRGRWPLYFDGDRQTFSMVRTDAGTAVMREMVSAGKAAKTKNRAEAQQKLHGFEELPREAAWDVPF